MVKVLLNIFKGRRTLPWGILDGLVLMLPPFRGRGNKVLVVKLEAIGDFVLWLDAAKTLIHKYQTQGRTVVLAGDKSWAGWAEDMRLADVIWSIDVRRFVRNLPYRWKWLRRVRKEGFEIVVQPTFSRMFLGGDSLVRASKSPERIGSEGDLSNVHPLFRLWSNHWYTRLIPATPKPLMEFQRNAEFMRSLGFFNFKPQLPIITQQHVELLSELPQKPYAVLFPGASWAGKAWPIENYAEIARRLINQSLQIVVAGGDGDRSLASYLENALPGYIVNLAGRTSLASLTEVLRSADIVITNDTSAVHIGAAVGARVVCILGGGHFGRFLPYDIEVVGNQRLPIVVSKTMPCFNCNWRCIHQTRRDEPVKCICDITVEDVWNEIKTAFCI